MRALPICLFLIIAASLSSVTMDSFLNLESVPSTLDDANVKIVESPSEGLIEIDTLSFDSVIWQGIQWLNHLIIIRPPRIESEVAVMFITGNYGYSQEELALFRLLALQNRAYVAVLFDIPNQPLFGGLKEDWLLSYSLVKCLETCDYTWPALLPMVQATIASMNIMKDFIGNKGDKVEGFILSGGSKRGWTTWLTAAMDKRVKGIVPIAFDNLNIAAQMEHQLEFWGGFSRSIDEYVQRGILDDLNNPAKLDLLEYIDPFTYRSQLGIPKLIVVGTNDPYWPIDSASLYLEELPGYSSMVYAPNAGHGAEVFRVSQAISSMIHHLNTGEPLPSINFVEEQSERTLKLRAFVEEESGKLKELRLFTSSSPDGDFRKARFESILVREGNSIELTFQGPTVFYFEGVFDLGGKELLISTPATVIGK